MKDQNLKNSDIGCVIVTFNRLDKLKKTLQSYAGQSLLPQYLIVVNNASTDGTKEYLESWKNKSEGFTKIVIHSEVNLGGSGGFYLGQQEAVEQRAGWIMIADDDAYPESNYLEGMQHYINTHDPQKISIVCGKVIQQGNSYNFHRGRWKSGWSLSFYTAVDKEDYKKDEFYPDFVSYVGIVINKEKLEEVGLVNKDIFIWYDDTEHTYRLSKVGKIVCIPRFSIIHDVDETHNGLSWKTYYWYRNTLEFYKKQFPLRYPILLGLLFGKTFLCPLKGKSLTEVKIRFAAIRDSLLNHMGKNEIYKPGWKP